MGCLGIYKTYEEYIKARDSKKTPRRKTRKWTPTERENRRRILWEEAKTTGILFGKPFINVLYDRYVKGAVKRGLEFNLSPEEFKSFWQMDCYYCGKKIETIGLDRTNNDIGYITSNIVPCCTLCNLTKRRMTDIEYIDHCKKVANQHLTINQKVKPDERVNQVL